MEIVTKNRQSKDVICRMTEKYMSPLKMTDCKELTEGLFNAAYEVYLNNSGSVIIKIAPPEDIAVQTYEKNIMYAEVTTMEKLAQYEDIPVPRIYGYDESCTVCPSPYFIMEKLRGESLNKIGYTFSKEQLDGFHFEIGKILKKLSGVVCPCFGLPGQREYQSDNWYTAFFGMMTSAIEDAARVDVRLEVPPEKLMKKLLRDKNIFDEVTAPALVHYDCWDGNIFIENGKITGIIDWERSIWGDPLMELGFRTFSPDPAFQKGYGLEKLSENQTRRALWYDVYMLALIASETAYRKYKIDYPWEDGVLSRQFAELEKY